MRIIDRVAPWRQVPLGRAFRRSFACGEPNLPALSVYLTEGVVPRSGRDDNHNVLGADLDKYLVVRPGDLVFNKLRTWQGGFGASAHVGIVSPAYFVLRPNAGVDSRFVDYQLHAAPYLAELTRVSKWQPPSQFDTPWDQLKTLPVSLPDQDRQGRIADFLDRECDRLARLISSLGLLQTRASEALLARIEEIMWPSSRVGVPLVELTDRSRPIMYGILMPGDHVPGGVPVVHGGHIERGDLDPGRLPRTTQELHAEYSRSQLRPGDLVMSVRGSFGAVAVVPDSLAGGNVSRDAARISPRDDVLADWLRFALLAPASQSALRITVVGAGVKGINIGAIRRVRVPSVSEGQRARDVALLRGEEARFQQIAARSAAVVRRLAEYRDALISEGVTGLIDVSACSEAQLEESAHAAVEGERPEVLSA